MLGVSKSVVVASALAVLALPMPATGWAAPGDLDPTFGTRGKVVTGFGGRARADAVIAMPDGKIVAGGKGELSDDFAVARYNPDGTLDSSFGDGGRVAIDFGLTDEIRGLVAQPDGKIIAAGSSKNADVTVGYFALARINPDGSLDTTFGNGGKVLTSFASFDVAHLGAAVRGVALRSDGKIVAGGTAGLDFALARYNPNGSLDTRFGNRGLVVTDVTGEAQTDHGFALAQLANEQLLLAGVSNNDFAVVRYNGNGTVDTSFGNAGSVRTDFSGAVDEAFSIAMRGDGGFLLSGSEGAPDPFGFESEAFGIASYRADGGLDASFDSDGKVTTSFTDLIDLARASALQSDGKLVAVGDAGNSGPVPPTDDCFNGGVCTGDFALARYNVDGSLDQTFGSGGKLTTDFGRGIAADGANSVVILSDGKILVAGVSDGNFALARYEG